MACIWEREGRGEEKEYPFFCQNKSKRFLAIIIITIRFTDPLYIYLNFKYAISRYFEFILYYIRKKKKRNSKNFIRVRAHLPYNTGTLCKMYKVKMASHFSFSFPAVDTFYCERGNLYIVIRVTIQYLDRWILANHGSNFISLLFIIINSICCGDKRIIFLIILIYYTSHF